MLLNVQWYLKKPEQNRKTQPKSELGPEKILIDKDGLEPKEPQLERIVMDQWIVCTLNWSILTG